MFELFIALFGGLYYGGKLLNDHSAHKKAVRDRTNAIARKEKWVEKVRDRALESELSLFISRPENRDKVLAEVSEVYDTILQGRRIDEVYPRWLWCKKKKGWSDQFHEAVQTIICRMDSTNALRIMMAKRGKFPSYDAVTGSAMMFSPNTMLEAYVLAWCAEELKRHGIEEEFCFPDRPVDCGLRGDGEPMGWII